MLGKACPIRMSESLKSDWCMIDRNMSLFGIFGFSRITRLIMRTGSTTTSTIAIGLPPWKTEEWPRTT